MRGTLGFTLLEVLVAVAIFALLGLVAYSGLDAALKAKSRLDDENHRWRGIALFWFRLEQDLAAVVDRPIRRQDGQASLPSLVGEAKVVGEYGAQLELTSLGADQGSTLPLEPRRLGYRLREGRVELLRWPTLDSPAHSRPHISVLLNDVVRLDFSYRDRNGIWSERWSGTDNEHSPTAIRILMRLNNGEEITRIHAR